VLAEEQLAVLRPGPVEHPLEGRHVCVSTRALIYSARAAPWYLFRVLAMEHGASGAA